MTKEFRHIGCGGEFDHGEPCSECGDYCKCGTVCAAPCPFCEETGANEAPEGSEDDTVIETTALPVASACEHCGSTDIFIEREDLSAYQARCNDCGSRGPIVEEGRYYDDEEAGQRDAIAAWNRRATPPALSASPAGWRSMDSAPKDGRDILVFDQDVFIASWTKGYDNIAQEPWEFFVTDAFDIIRNPTHWLPLPPAPTAAPSPDPQTDHSGEWRLWWQGSGPERGDHIMATTPSGLRFGDEIAYLGDQHHEAADALVMAHNEALAAALAAARKE